jgi:Dolichyl-phosphate-mannose-protein mannosyltransferase
MEDFLAVTEAQDPVRRVVWRAFWASRLVVFLAGVVAVAQFGNQSVSSTYDPDGLTRPFGYFANLLVSPFARWDSAWYLAVAKWGYGPQTGGVPLNPPGAVARMNFFPLYPALTRVFGWVVRSDLIAGALISLLAFAVALWLLYRLVRLDFSARVAEVTVLLVAFCPMAFYFSAVYTESLFMALSLAAVYCARRDRWLSAGLLGALATVTRVEGVVLVVPLLLIAVWRLPTNGRSAAGEPSAGGVRAHLKRPRIAVAWLALLPLALLAFIGYLALRYGHGLAPFQTQSEFWQHQRTWPFGAAWQGAKAAWNGLRQLIQGPVPPYRIPLYTGGPSFSAMQDLYLFAFLVLVVVAFIGGLRRLHPAYSAYTFLSLALPLSDPVKLSPLASIPRYAMVAFPLFIWVAQVVVRRRLTVQAVAIGAVLLGLFTAEFATWLWVG